MIIITLRMSLPTPIIAKILRLADLPIDTRLFYNIKPRKLMSPFIQHDPDFPIHLMRTHAIMDYISVRMKGPRVKCYPECFRIDYECSHHQLRDEDPDTWLCHAEYHAMYHDEAFRKSVDEVYSVITKRHSASQ